ncbi:MAG: SDR family oxidoreductase [Anaerolineales bacterium]|nr:SDR family oxidoreductase [Anaerolineales bacterium]MCS7246889.1 SDR family oxidoreductase [Anaerolineales bacterium]MDW8160700.1 SDR family oxidoreductase [Anaerolineales bacterium]MDW8448172.1 SDR family oxidoreductase [Anaerolineales bacterium]
MTVVLITGASSGIGAGIARLAAERGYDLAITARRLDRLEALRRECEVFGVRVLTIQADLMQKEQVQLIAQTVLNSFGGVDVLINNAGFGRVDWLENLDEGVSIAGQIQVNLVAPIQLTRQVLPTMIARRKGHIINIASIASFIAPPTYSVYAASKFGLHGFTEALRREVAGYGIYVSGVYPGGVATEFAAKAGIERKSRVTTPSWMRLSAEQVAKATLELLDHPRREVVLPGYMSLLIWLNRFAPALVDWIVDRGFVQRERGDLRKGYPQT